MAQPDVVTQFRSVDQAVDPGHFVRVLEIARNLPGITESRADIIDGLRLAPGHEVLEVGCGLGDDAATFGRLVSPGGRVVAIDLSSFMLEEAARRTADLGLPLSFSTGDVTKLDFPDASFDACRTERVLCYVADPEHALSEMVRVTRPGGRVSVFDVDFGTFVVDHPDPELTQRMVASVGGSFPSGRLGRRLARMFTDAGLDDVSVTGRLIFFASAVLDLVFAGQLSAAVTAGEFTEAEVAGWWEALHATAPPEHPIGSCGAYIVAGTKR